MYYHMLSTVLYKTSEIRNFVHYKLCNACVDICVFCGLKSYSYVHTLHNSMIIVAETCLEVPEI